MTGGASASDEFIELYNPSAVALPLEGLEVIYVTASGGTITRKASWAAGAPSLPPGAHLLIANERRRLRGHRRRDLRQRPGGDRAAAWRSGSWAPATAIDAVGWGTAASTWLEGSPTPAPAAGHPVERLPGGSGGSGQDTE